MSDGRPCENAGAMADAQRPPELQPVPGTARGRGRWSSAGRPGRPPTRRRAGVFRRALRREASRLRDPRPSLAIVLLSLTFSCWPGLIGRGEAAGADARAYWAGVRIWLNGGDPYHPTGPFLPYVYAPWMLPLFAPWALLPWDVAWFVWRVGTILLLLWTVPLGVSAPATDDRAVVVVLLAFPFGANLDTGNINLQLTLMLWAAQFSGPRLGGLLWALATWMKWIPVIVWPILPPATRKWGLIWLAVSIAQPGAVAADDRAVPDAVRLRGAPDPARLPGLPVGVRAIVAVYRWLATLGARGRGGSTTGRSGERGDHVVDGPEPTPRADRRVSKSPTPNRSPPRRGPGHRSMISPRWPGDHGRRGRGHVREAHVSTRRGLRDDVRHQRPVDGQERARRRPEERRADDREWDGRRERRHGDPDGPRSRSSRR